MIVHDGIRIYEFRRSSGHGTAGDVLKFWTREGALSWLLGLRSRKTDLASGVRNLLAHPYTTDCYRLTDRQVLEEAALRLRSEQLMVIQTESHAWGSGALKPPVESVPMTVATPARRSSAAPEVEQPTFSGDLLAQAGVLTAAAAGGAPFCPV